MFRAAMFRRALSSGNKLTQKSFFERILKSLSQFSSGEAEMERKAESQAILANVRKKLTHASTNYQTSNDIDTWTELDFPVLTENQLMELAQYHFQGGKARNAELAVKAWKEASDRGNKDALYSYGACLRSGIGITKDPVHALEVLLTLAESHNNPFAHHACGIMFENGEGTPIDMQKAFKHYQKAANLGIPPAAYNLGNLYATGNGCEQSDEKAFHCFAVAANAGEKSAKYFYATYLCEGKGCTKDLELGIRTHKELAEAGHPRSAHNLGVYYLEGKEVPKDVNEAIKWFTVGAKSGLFQSTFNLGQIFFEGNEVPQDLKKAEEWFAVGLVQSRNNETCFEYLQETRRLLALERK